MSRRYDDLDPCWVSARTLCFASTRGAMRTQYAGVPATNLFLVDVDDPRPPVRITSDRDGAEEPAYDPARRRIVYARWWYNRHRPSRSIPGGLTTDAHAAVAGDTVNGWQAVSIDLAARDARLAAGAVRPRRDEMGYQPCVLPNGDIAAVYAMNMGLSPSSGPLGIHRLGRSGEPVQRVAGALIDDDQDSYGSPNGLAAPSACSPAVLPDGRLVFAYDPGASGDYGLYTVGLDGENPERVVDLPHTLELDPAVVVRWRGGAAGSVLARDHASTDTFTFFCRNLFASGGLKGIGPAPPIAWPLFVRFYRSRPAATASGDTIDLVREEPVRPDGSIRVTGLPADQPMFEQIVDDSGLPLLTAHGAAHVAGFNFGRPGAVVRCVGCHAGHSMLPADGPDARFLRFDASASAEASSSSRAPGTSGPAALVDRRLDGPIETTAWVARRSGDEWAALEWPMSIRLQEVVLHPVANGRDPSHVIEGCDLVLMLREGIVRRIRIGRLAGPVRLNLHDALCDRIEVRDFHMRPNPGGSSTPALAEIEAWATLDARELAGRAAEHPRHPERDGSANRR
jgi:hypothetical protein